MIFFRTQRIAIKLKKGSLPKRTFFIWVKVLLNGPVDSESGMVINLKFVDMAFSELKSQDLNFKSFLDCIHHIDSFFKIKFSHLYSGTELTIGNKKLIYHNQKLSGVHKTQILIKENKSYVHRGIEIEFNKISFSQLRSWISLQNKKSREEILTAFLKRNSQLISFKIEYPEWKGWECFSLH